VRVSVVYVRCVRRRQKVDKWWLCDIGDIRPRDLSIVWPPSLQNVGATLLVRGRAIIVHTLNIRAGTSHTLIRHHHHPTRLLTFARTRTRIRTRPHTVVLHDRVMLFQSDDPASQAFVGFLKTHLKFTNPLPQTSYVHAPRLDSTRRLTAYCAACRVFVSCVSCVVCVVCAWSCVVRVL
jgi:hypothetical protein